MGNAQEPTKGSSHLIRGDSKVQSLSPLELERIHPQHSATLIHKRTAAISGIETRIDLNILNAREALVRAELTIPLVTVP